jgi:hypothetical protein
VSAAAAASARHRTSVLADHLRTVLEEHAAITGIGDALLAAFGDAARSTAATIRTEAGAAMREVSVPPCPEPGRDLVAGLLTDPAADFPEDQR